MPTSREVTYIGDDGLTVINDNDSKIFGSGLESARPVTGDVQGDIYVVIDTTGQVYRLDLWNGSTWVAMQADPVGATSGTHGDLLYRDASKWTALSAGTEYQVLQTRGAGADPSWSGVKIYPNSASDPVSPAPAQGDRYYNTSLELDMVYDGSRAKWLSVETFLVWFGRNGNVGTGAYFRGHDRRAYSATSGFRAFFNGTVVAMSLTRSDATDVDIEATANGTTIATLAVGTAGSARDITLDGDFNQDDILGARNSSGSAGNVNNTQGSIRVRWRA